MGLSNLLVFSPYHVSANATLGAYCQALHMVGLIQMYCYACGTLIQDREEIEEELIESWLEHSVHFSYIGVRSTACYLYGPRVLIGLPLSIVISFREY